MNRDMVTAYVERLLEDITGNERVSADLEGDYPFRYADALYYVRVDGIDRRPVVRVFSVALAEIEPAPELFEALNDVNTRLHCCRCFWVNGQVLFEDEILGAALNREALESTIEDVAGAADYFGPQLQARFGGRLAFDESKGPDHQPVDLVAGGYL